MGNKAIDLIAVKINELETSVNNFQAESDSKAIEIYTTITGIIYQLEILESRNMHLEEIRELKEKCIKLREITVSFGEKYMEQFKEIDSDLSVNEDALKILLDGSPDKKEEPVIQEQTNMVEQYTEDTPVELGNNVSSPVLVEEKAKVLSLTKPTITRDIAA